MKHTSYFLILPRPELTARFHKNNDAGGRDLMEPVLWTGSESDAGSLWHAEMDMLTKMLFLDTILRERRLEAGFDKVFPDLLITTEYFDSLWTLQRVSVDMSIEFAIRDAIETDTINSLKNTGNERFDELLAFYLANPRFNPTFNK